MPLQSFLPPESEAAAIARMEAAALQALRPPPKLSLSEWADEYFVLSAESSSEPGSWTTIPFQRGWMDAISNTHVRKVTIMKSARVGYTKTFTAAIGYHVHQDPCSVLVLQPTDEDAKGFSTEELQPMFRDVEPLRGKLTAMKADGRRDRQTMLKLQTPGGMVTVAGAKSPKNFRRITVRKVFRDEIDAYEATKREGDPIALSAKRTQTAHAPQEVNGSTPTLKGFSLIEREYEASDQRIYEVPCPHCGTFQRLIWGGVKWPKGEPDKAYYECQANGCVIEEREKTGMIAKGRWVAQKPFDGHAGFHIGALYSPFPGARWSVLAREFIAAKAGGPATLQPFINTVLGETWDAGGEGFEPDSLMARREDYPETAVPGRAVLITAGVDIQDDRFELEVVGWAPNHETWSIDYVRHYGDPSTPGFWEALDAQLSRRFTHPSGLTFGVEAACVDSGGHYADEVYAFCRPRFRRRVFATKGASTWDAPIWPKKRASRAKKGALLFVVGVNAAKMKTYIRMQAEEGEAGFCHFPTRYGQDYFDMLTAERLVKEHRKGFEIREFRKEPGRRNEAWDCRIYATCARESLSLDLHKRANDLEATSDQATRPVTRRQRSRRSSYLRD
ncbi:MAG: phage terminase large subunit family protein [Pseudomonadota bacterium]